jgi:hypothetical protein
MGQTYDEAKPISGTTTFGELYLIIRNHIDAAITNMVGGSAPATPDEGMTWYDSTNDRMYVYDGSSWRDIDYNTTVNTEVVAARGSTGSLATRLSVSINADGTLSGGTVGASWWSSGTTPWRYYSTVQWEESGDKTGVYTVGRALYIAGTATPGNSFVTASAYSGTSTIVTIKDAILDASMSTPQFGQADHNYHHKMPWTRVLWSNSATSRDTCTAGLIPVADGSGGVTLLTPYSAVTAAVNLKKYSLL